MACLGLHLFFIFSVCVRDTFSIFATTPTIFSPKLAKYWRGGEQSASAALGQQLAASNPVRNAIAVYLHGAGIEAGYGFFAPNVPNNYKLVFELHYADGRIDYELPRVGSAAAGLRLSTLIDNIGGAPYNELREVMVKMMAYSIWQEHPDATLI